MSGGRCLVVISYNMPTVVSKTELALCARLIRPVNLQNWNLTCDTGTDSFNQDIGDIRAFLGTPNVPGYPAFAWLGFVAASGRSVWLQEVQLAPA